MKENNCLAVHEWGVVVVFASVMTAIALFTTLKSDPKIIPDQLEIQVTATGAVENRGVHFLPQGATAADLIGIACPKPHSIAVGVKPDDRLQDGQRVYFKSQLVTVHLRGAVKRPKLLKLKLGSVLGDAYDKIEFSPGADVQKVQDRQIKRSGQVVTIPKKK